MNNNNKKYLLTLFLSSFILFVLFFYSLMNALPANTLNADEDRNILFKLMPQGWGFFSLPPTEDYFVVLDKNLNIVANWPNMSIKNIFGINRAGRAQGIELGTLSYEIKVKNCNDSLSECIDFQDAIPLINNNPNPTLCGELIIANIEPVPWAWADITSLIDQPSKYNEVDIQCE